MLTGDKNKPNILLYNETKAGVDTGDKLLKQYTCNFTLNLSGGEPKSSPFIPSGINESTEGRSTEKYQKGQSTESKASKGWSTEKPKTYPLPKNIIKIGYVRSKDVGKAFLT